MDGMREQRITDLGKRANALRRSGFYSRDEVKWFSEYVRQPGASLIECEMLIVNAEQIVRWEKKSEPAASGE